MLIDWLQKMSKYRTKTMPKYQTKTMSKYEYVSLAVCLGLVFSTCPIFAKELPKSRIIKTSDACIQTPDAVSEINPRTRLLAQVRNTQQADLTTIRIDVPPVPPPAGFPPFPESVDVPVSLEQETNSQMPPEDEWNNPIPTRNNAKNFAGPAAYSQQHAVLGQRFLLQQRVVDGYKEIKIALELNKWRPTDRPNAAQCHRMLGDILLEYAMKAKDTGRGSRGMQRLMNCWIEYKQALFLDPSDPKARAGLLSASNALVGIDPSFNNLLSLGSVSYLSGDPNKALACYQRCAQLVQEGKSNAPMGLVSDMASLIGKLQSDIPNNPNNNLNSTNPSNLNDSSNSIPSNYSQAGQAPAGSQTGVPSGFQYSQGPAGSQGSAGNQLPAESAGPPLSYQQHVLSMASKGKSVVQDEESAGQTAKPHPFYVDNYVENARRNLAREWHLCHVQTRNFPTIAFALDKKGNITELRVTKSSGDAGVDEMALNVARRVAPFPDTPSGLGEITETFDDKKETVDLADYMRQLRRKIRHNWHPPHDLQEDHVIVSFKLHRDGSVDNIVITQPSASDARNQSSIAAIKGAAPFQHLPAEAPDSVDIQFHFDHDIETRGDG